MRFFIYFNVSKLRYIFIDLFAELLPVSIHHALSAYETRRNELVNYEVSNLREMTQLLNRYMYKILIC